MAGVNASELQRAAEEWQERQGPAQPELFAAPDDVVSLPAPAPVERRRGGRPIGSKNLRTIEVAQLYRRRHGDPLDIASEIAAKDVLDPEVVRELAQTWGCSRHEAVKLWSQVNRDVQQYHHAPMPKAVILNPGDPAGERVLLDLGDGDYREIPDGAQEAT